MKNINKSKKILTQKLNNKLNLRFRLSNNKESNKEINDLLDKNDSINKANNNKLLKNNQEQNKIKDDLSIWNPYNKDSKSYRNKKNDILLIENKLKNNSSSHPIFLSLMANKKHFIDSFEKKMPNKW